jgi:predicted cupin superfamily sugar epimerase
MLLAMLTADELIAFLHLQPLPGEGGYYRETYRSADRLPAAGLPGRYHADKSAATAIYYLLTPDMVSALHRLPTDEIFHFYLGAPVQMLQLWPDGRGRVVFLGPDLEAGQSPQVVVPRGVWQGSWLAPGGSFALLGTTMAPGFDFTDYEAGDRARLTAQYPNYAEPISRLTSPIPPTS